MASGKKALSKEVKTTIAYTSICVAVVFIVLLLNNFGVFTQGEYSSYDLRFRIRGIEDHADDIVIVGLDAQSLEMLGLINMPPRDYHAALTANLFKAGAKAVLFDFLFLTYTGQTADDGFSSLEVPMSREDSLLADALKMYPNTLISRKTIVKDATQMSVGESPLPPPAFRNPDQLTFVDMYQDNDSFIRRAKLFSEEDKDEIDPALGWNYSFALRAAMYAMDADTAWIDYGKNLGHVGDRVIPLDKSGFMYINFPVDENTFQEMGGYISYEQVLDDSEWGLGILMENDRLKDKVVMVGAAWKESGDVKATPFYLGTSLFSPNEFPMYGVHVHKAIASTIINDRFIPPVKNWHLVSLVILMAVLATLINFKFKGFLGLFFSLVIIGIYSFVAVYLFLSFRKMIPVVAPAYATVIINYISVVTYNFLTERKQKAMIRGTFSHYVPPSVVGELLKNPEMLTLGGEERVMTVIFSDVAGFTSISENLTPQELVELLNEYLTAMTDIVLEYDGIIDKYEGDAIMAEFGAPLEDKDHALKACYTALDMQVKLAELRVKLKSEGRAELRARVGINSGSMVIGNMGSNSIFDYTVMGDNVNLSSRLEGANKEYGTYIMCSEATRQMTKEKILYRELDLLRVKGKSEGVLVHEALARVSEGLSEDRQKVMDLYALGLAAYKEKRWDDGIARFSEALEIDPEDPPSKVYKNRCIEFKNTPPPDDWDGIFTMMTK